MTSDEKMLDVEAQVREISKGEADSILCPYCGALNERGSVICCHTLMTAILAAVQRMDDEKRMETAERIRDKVSVH